MHSVLHFPFRDKRSLTHCYDQRPPLQGGTFTEQPPPTGYADNRIVDNQIVDNQEDMNFTEDDQINEVEDGVKSVSCNRSLTPSTYDSAKASRRHRKRTSMTNNFVLCWLHHCIYKSEEQMQNDHKFITPNEKV